MEQHGVDQFAKLYGKGLEALFPEGSAGMTSAPWQRAARRKDLKDYEGEKVGAALRNPTQEISHIDPRHLQATQPNVTRAGVAYYMGDEYSRTGRTFADQDQAGNRLPVVYTRPRCPDCTDKVHMLLSGHHRAAAALLKGEQLAHISVEGGWGGPR